MTETEPKTPKSASKAERLKAAQAERDRAARAWDEAFRAWDKARRAWDKARRAWDKAERKVRAIEAEP